MSKETVEFELAFKTNNQRFYKASKPLVNDAKGRVYFELGNKWKVYKDESRKELEEWQIPDSFDYVVVSDAHTHLERLAFAGFSYDSKVNDGRPALFKCDTIAGVNTFMIHGGDSRAVKPDEVYLRMISKANGFQYKKSNKDSGND